MTGHGDRALDRLRAGLFVDDQPPEGRRAPPEVVEAARDPARHWGKYVLVEEVGQGGFSLVFKAWQEDVARWVAVKVPKPRVTVRLDMLRREAQSAASLTDPRIPQIYEIGMWEDKPFIAMQFVQGRSLGEIDLAPSRAIAVVREAAAAVAHAHANGIVHRDLKPRNIMLCDDGRVFVTDFGVARMVDAETTIAPRGVVVGTPQFMAPEQIQGDAASVGPWTDVWGLGATLHALLAGEPPFGRDGYEDVRRRILTEEPASLLDCAPGTPPQVAAVVARCLQKDPRARYRDGHELDRALRRAEGGTSAGLSASGWGGDRRSAPPPPETAETAPAPPPGAAQKTTVAVTRRRRASLLAVAAAGAVAIGGAVFLVATRDTGPSGATEPADAPPAGVRPTDARLADARTLVLRGEHEKALEDLETYLAGNPTDPDALTLVVLAQWWGGGDVDAVVQRALQAPLRPAQGALVRGLRLVNRRREEEAVVYLQAADRRDPGQAEILYALGEALWHCDRMTEGAAALRAAFEADPAWEVALVHVIDHELAGGRAGNLEPIVARLRSRDPEGAAALECARLTAQGRYGEAIRTAREALGSAPDSVRLWIRLAQALALEGDLAAGESAAKTAFERSPVDDREMGGFAHRAEFLLYAGDADGYLRTIGDRRSRVRDVAAVMWGLAAAPEPSPTRGHGMRPPPLGVAALLLGAHSRGEDARDLYESFPDPEARALGEGLAAERDGRSDAAVAAYRRGLEAPSGGDVRMLLSHGVARILHAAGDPAGAAAACDEVLHPRVYRPHRAVLLPDCLLWTGEATGDAALFRRLVDAWGGGFHHPAVAAARAWLAGASAPDVPPGVPPSVPPSSP